MKIFATNCDLAPYNKKQNSNRFRYESGFIACLIIMIFVKLKSHLFKIIVSLTSCDNLTPNSI
jgi:hypothetical protein